MIRLKTEINKDCLKINESFRLLIPGLSQEELQLLDCVVILLPL